MAGFGTAYGWMRSGGFERREFSFVILRGTGHRPRAALVGAAAPGPGKPYSTSPAGSARLANFLQTTIALAGATAALAVGWGSSPSAAAQPA